MPAAIPGVSSSTPPAYSRSAAQGGSAAWNVGPTTNSGGGSFVRVVSPDRLAKQDRDNDAKAAQTLPNPQDTSLASFVRNQWMIFRNQRNTGNDPLNYRLLRAQRMIDGKYDYEVLRAIKQFGGSEVYSRMVAVKCRGATSLLRDVYLGANRPWDIDPEPDPPVPPDIRASIAQLIAAEVQGARASGQPVLPEQVHMRFQSLIHAAQQAARRAAMMQATAASEKMNDMLQEGGLYDALTAFLVDLPIFPFACLKGPTVRMVTGLKWNGNTPTIKSFPRLCWERVSPFNVYWSPGASCVEEANILERKRLTRADLNDLLGLPGFNQKEVRGAIDDYSRGLREWLDYPDAENALNTGREDPNLNLSEYIDAIEYHGMLQGRFLLDQGIDKRLIPDLDRDYATQVWVVGQHTLKVQLNPSPRQRHPYYITSYEKVPGAVAGHGLPDILEDMQEICNATLRALVNNMGISSGPQVVVNDDAVTPIDNEDMLYPWKRWHVSGDPLGSQGPPVTFFQPPSNSQELLGVYTAINNLADDISAIPRYVTGSGTTGGAGRTASGLSMLIGNASKLMQTVAANVDNDILRPLLQQLYDIVMLTDESGMLTGNEQIEVNGVTVALQKETERQKQLQFLQITANPIDALIVGELGRARVLRSIAQGLGLPDDIVPDDETLQQQIQAKEEAQKAAAAMAVHGTPMGAFSAPGQPGAPQQAPQGPVSPGAAAQGAQHRQATPERLADHAPPVNSFEPLRAGASIHGPHP